MESRQQAMLKPFKTVQIPWRPRRDRAAATHPTDSSPSPLAPSTGREIAAWLSTVYLTLRKIYGSSWWCTQRNWLLFARHRPLRGWLGYVSNTQQPRCRWCKFRPASKACILLREGRQMRFFFRFSSSRLTMLFGFSWSTVKHVLSLDSIFEC